MDEQILMVATVGGSPDQLVRSILQHRPAALVFVHTPQTFPHTDLVLEKGQKAGWSILPSMVHRLEIEDGESLGDCVKTIGRARQRVQEWAAKDQMDHPHRVVAEFTGGTKCMSAALVLHARLWPCTFSYVGGNYRTKDGMGTVVPGHEKVLQAENPWELLGFQSLEEYTGLFNEGSFRAASMQADRTKRLVGPEMKHRFEALLQLAQAYDHWDGFRHNEAFIKLDKELPKYSDALTALLGEPRHEYLRKKLREHRGILEKLTGESQIHLGGRRLVADLLANAARRLESGRPDDAIARAYRAIEATGHLTLAESHGINANQPVDVEKLPIPAAEKPKWAAHMDPKTGKFRRLALQETFTLLKDLADPLAAKFGDMGLGGEKSLLTRRNQSVLGHGFQAMGDKEAKIILNAAKDLAEVKDQDLVDFPKL